MRVRLIAALVLIAVSSVLGVAGNDRRYEDGFRRGLETAAKNNKTGLQLAYVKPRVLATAVLATYIRHPDCDEFVIGGPYIDGPDFLHPAPPLPIQTILPASSSPLSASVTDDLGQRWKVTGIGWQRGVVWKHDPLEWHIDVDGPGLGHSETIVSLPSTAARSDYPRSQTRTYVAGVGWISSRSYVTGGPQTRLYKYVSFVFARRKTETRSDAATATDQAFGPQPGRTWEPIRSSRSRFLTLTVNTPDGEVALKWDTTAAELLSQGGIGPALLDEASQESSHDAAQETQVGENKRASDPLTK